MRRYWWMAGMLAAALGALAGEVELFPSATALGAWQSSGAVTVTVRGEEPDAWAMIDDIAADGDLTADVAEPDWRGAEALCVTLSAAELKSHVPVQISCFVTGQDTERYRFPQSVTLAPGETKTLRLPLDSLVIGVPARPADPYLLHYVRQVGFRPVAESSARLRLLRIWLVRPDTGPVAAAPQVIQPPALHGEAVTGRPAEVRFDFTPRPANPYVPERAVTLSITGPGGWKQERPCFFSRDYRSEPPAGDEHPVAAGPHFWAGRFTPPKPGRYSCRVTLGGEAFGEPLSVEVAPPAAPWHGYIVPVPNDRGCFQFEDDTPFFPIGVDFCWPWDAMYGAMTRDQFPASRELALYDDYFRELSEAGGNCSQIWMTPFWTALVWSRHHDGYGGLDHYNLEAAWRLDAVLAAARRHRIYLIMTLMNHHQFFDNKGNVSEWEGNPWNAANGGPLEDRTTFLADPAARAAYAGMLRYILARWGDDPMVLSYNLISELDNTAAGTNDESIYVRGHEQDPITPHSQEARDWMHEMRGVGASIEPERALFTAGNCQEGRLVAHQNYASPELQLVMTDTYTHGSWTPAENVHAIIHGAFETLDRYGKPMLLTEMGYHNGGDSAPEAAVGLHCSTWTSTMFPFCGAALYWWWNVVHQERLYPLITPVTKFWRGEDRRGQLFSHMCLQGPKLSGEPAFGAAEPFWAYGLRGRTRFYAILFPRHEARYFMEEPPVIRAARWRVNPRLDGKVVVEWWDTYTGEIIGREVQPNGQVFLSLTVPDFTRDIAVKIRPLGASAITQLAPRRLPDPPPPASTLTVECHRLIQAVPRNEAEAKSLVGTGQLQGRGSWPRLDVRINPFGHNEHFYAVYEGQLTCPAEGSYTFALNSDDASFLWIDGKLVVEWPAEHYPDKKEYGLSNVFDHQGEVTLTAGAHAIRVLHVNNKGAAILRVGWQPPGAEKVVVVPDEAFRR